MVTASCAFNCRAPCGKPEASAPPPRCAPKRVPAAQKRRVTTRCAFNRSIAAALRHASAVLCERLQAPCGEHLLLPCCVPERTYPSPGSDAPSQIAQSIVGTLRPAIAVASLCALADHCHSCVARSSAPPRCQTRRIVLCCCLSVRTSACGRRAQSWPPLGEPLCLRCVVRLRACRRRPNRRAIQSCAINRSDVSASVRSCHAVRRSARVRRPEATRCLELPVHRQLSCGKPLLLRQACLCALADLCRRCVVRPSVCQRRPKRRIIASCAFTCCLRIASLCCCRAVCSIARERGDAHPRAVLWLCTQSRPSRGSPLLPPCRAPEHLPASSEAMRPREWRTQSRPYPGELLPPPHQVSTGVCKRHSARHAFLGSTPNDGRFAVGLGRRRVVRRSAYQRRPMRRAADRCAFGWLPSFCARVRMSSSPGATCFASCAFIQLRSSDGRPLPLPRPASERVPASPGAASTRAALSIAALSWQASAAASLCALASHCHRCVVHLSVRQRCHRAAPSRVVHSVAAVLRQAPDAVTLCVHHHRCSSSCCVRYRRRGLPAPWLIKLRAPPSPQVMPPLHLRRCGSSSCVCRHCRSLSRCVRHYRRGPCHRLPCQCGSPSCCACSASAAAPATAWRSTAL